MAKQEAKAQSKGFILRFLEAYLINPLQLRSHLLADSANETANALRVVGPLGTAAAVCNGQDADPEYEAILPFYINKPDFEISEDIYQEVPPSRWRPEEAARPPIAENDSQSSMNVSVQLRNSGVKEGTQKMLDNLKRRGYIRTQESYEPVDDCNYDKTSKGAATDSSDCDTAHVLPPDPPNFPSDNSCPVNEESCLLIHSLQQINEEEYYENIRNYREECPPDNESDCDSNSEMPLYDNIGENRTTITSISSTESSTSDVTSSGALSDAEETESSDSQETKVKKISRLQKSVKRFKKRKLVHQESLSIDPFSNNPINLSRLNTKYLYYINVIKQLSSTVDPTTHYKFKCLIGEGGFGKVYKARDLKRENCFVAIKYINLVRNTESLGYLAQEIGIMRILLHENIINFIDSYLKADSLELCLVMEFVDGLPLNEIVEPRQGISDEQVIAAILKQCVAALAYLHSRNIIHRDIKSDNVMVGNNGIVKLLDFGACAKLWSAEVEKRLTFMGTPYWIAPEVIKGQPYACKVDVWSTGIMTCECITGTPPFYKLAPNEALKKICTSGVASFIKRLKVSNNCKRFLERCCTVRVNQRASMSELSSHPFLQSASRTQLIRDLVDLCLSLKSN